MTVTFLHGKQETATANGRWEDRDKAAPGNTIVYDTKPDGSWSVREIRLAGSRQVIVFDNSSPQSQVVKPGTQTAKLVTTNRLSDAAKLSRIRFVGKPDAHPRTQDRGVFDPTWAQPVFNFMQPVMPPNSDRAEPRHSPW